VNAYLEDAGASLAALRTALKHNATLAELATTPLMLQVLIVTYGETVPWELPQKRKDLQRQIWKEYIECMVAQKGDVRRYPLDPTISWLSWLARQMRQRNQTIFSLEGLQPDILPEQYINHYQWGVHLLVGSLFGLAYGLLGGAFGELAFGPG